MYHYSVAVRSRTVVGFKCVECKTVYSTVVEALECGAADLEAKKGSK